MLAAKGLIAAAVGLGLAFGPQPARFAERAVDIPPGTSIPITLDQDIPVKQDQFGREFPAHVTRDVTIDSKVTIPEGTPGSVKLVPSSEKSDNVTLRLVELRVNGETQSVKTGDARPDTERSHHGLGEKTGIGAAAGAVVGAITGAGIVKGAVVGAGGGLAWGLLGGGKQIGRDTRVEFHTK
jgi:hypothetical protein